MADLHPDAREVVVRVDGEVEYSRYIRDGGIEVLVDPEGPGTRNTHRESR